ncbi:MAG: M56 family metallopeptidase [Lachnospiraceae bacterium]
MLEWGITSTLFVLAVLVIRCLFKNKISRRVMYLLWLPVLLRLLLPVTLFHNSYGVANYLPQKEEPSVVAFETVPANVNGDTQVMVPVIMNNHEEIPEYIYESNADAETNNQVITINENVVHNEQPSKNHAVKLNYNVLFIIWCAGVAVTGVTFLLMNLIFTLRIRKTGKKYDRYNNIDVYDSKLVVSPCLSGLFSPKILLNTDVIDSEKEYGFVLEHEYTHYLHRDNIWAVLRMAAICLHWYNPLVWYGARVSIQDCEMACDEAVIKKVGEADRIAYGNTLLHMISVGGGFKNIAFVATTMVDSKKNIKERIISIAKKPRVSKIIMAVAVILVTVIAVIAFSGKKNDDKKTTPDETVSSEETTEADEIEPFVDTWAQAICDNDFEALSYYMSDEMKGKFEKDGFPLENYAKCGYNITKNKAGHAQIMYYVVASDYHLDYWVEDIYMIYSDKRLVVQREETVHFDVVIDSSESFMQVFPFTSYISGTPADYQTNGIGEKLNEEALGNREKYAALFEPDTAAEYIFNLVKNNGLIEYSIIREDASNAILRVDFNKEHPVYFLFKMVKPYGEEGIWVVDSMTSMEYVFNGREIASYKADLTGDGMDDVISVKLMCYDTDDIKDAEYLVNYKNRTILITIVDGASPYSNYLYVKGYSAQHSDNGEMSLVRRNGKYYILETRMWTGQGEYDFEVNVFDFKDGNYNVVDTYSKGGKIEQAPYSEYMESIMPWAEDGIVLCACNSNSRSGQDVCISMRDKQYGTKDFFREFLARYINISRHLRIEGKYYTGTDVIGELNDTYKIEGYIESTVSTDEIEHAPSGASDFGCVGNPYTGVSDKGYRLVMLEDGKYHYFYQIGFITYSFGNLPTELVTK